MITDRIKARRRYKIGSSDSPMNLNISHFGNRADLYNLKVHGVEFGKSEQMSEGDWAEKMLCEWIGEQIGHKPLYGNLYRVSRGRDSGIMAANHDVLFDRRLGVGGEAKLVGGEYLNYWGNPGTDQVDPMVMVQVQHQMYVSDLDRVYIAMLAYKYRPQRRLYVVKRSERLIRIIVDAAMEFYHCHLVPRVPPPDIIPTIGTAKAIERKFGVRAVVDSAVIARWRRAERAYKPISKEREWATAALLQALQEAEIGSDGQGQAVSYKADRRGYRRLRDISREALTDEPATASATGN
jgi:predicted phage-related endonuclease